MKKIIIICAVIAIAIAIIFIVMPSDEKRIAATVVKGSTAIENEDIDKLMSVISMAYRDEFGLAYLTVRQAFGHMFEQFDDISVSCRITEINIEKDTAKAVCDIWSTGKIGGQKYRIIASSSDPQTLTLTLAKGELSWKVISSQWSSFPSVEALINQQFYIPGPSRR